MELVINRTTDLCIDISTNFDDNPVNVDKRFSIQLSSSNPDICINSDKAVASVVIENSEQLDRFL